MKTKQELIKKIGGQEVLDERAEHILDQEVYCQADSLVEYLQGSTLEVKKYRPGWTSYPEKETRSIYIEWEFTPDKEDGEKEGYFPEIFQYWLISEYLYDRMKEHNIAPVAYIEEVNLYIWGRTCCGQAIMQDGTLQDVILAIEENL